MPPLPRPLLRLPPRLPQIRPLSIFTSTTPSHPSTLKFHPSTPVLDPNFHSTSMEFHSSKATQTSPLAQRLFTIPGVSAVAYGPDYITVSKTGGDIGWGEIRPRVERMVEEALEGGEEIVVDPGKGTEPVIEPYGGRN